MTFAEIAAKYEQLRLDRIAVPDVGYSNYRKVLEDYERILNDMLVLGRNLAQNLVPADEEVVVIQAGDTK